MSLFLLAMLMLVAAFWRFRTLAPGLRRAPIVSELPAESICRRIQLVWQNVLRLHVRQSPPFAGADCRLRAGMYDRERRKRFPPETALHADTGLFRQGEMVVLNS